MPRTRNVTRAQWDAANALNSTTIRDRNHGCESEKENEGRSATRATRSQTRTGSNRVLGSTTTANLRISTTSKGLENTVSTNTTKGKGKAKARAPPPKRNKVPLQDITSQFLPAPEAVNRGEENEVAEHQQTQNGVNLVSPLPLTQILGGDVLGHTISMSHPVRTYSPLPPSSPPAMTSSPQYPKINSNLPSENNLWNQFDHDYAASHGSVISSSSDPFGFIALERKLKVERTAPAPSSLKRHHHQAESEEELDQILVADTSSPRLVRRVKRPSYQGESSLPPAIFEHPYYAAPSTPRKDKKRQRLSREEDRIFSPSSSSIPSTPSPSKPSVQQRAQEAGREDIPLENDLKGNRGIEGIFGKPRSRTAKVEPSPTSKPMTPLKLWASLDNIVEAEEGWTDPKGARVAKSKKIPKKPRSTGIKKTKEKTKEKNDDGDGDYGGVCPISGLAYSIKLTPY